MRILRRLSQLRRKTAFDRELREELEFHRAQLQEALERQGLSPADAALESRRRMGNVALAREESREIWLWRSLDAIRQDVRYAFRTFIRDPLFAPLSLITLSLGIGGATALFSIVYAIALAPLPYRDPATLLELRGSDEGWAVSLEQYQAVVAQSHTLSSIAAGRRVPTRPDDTNPPIVRFACTENLFDVLGVPAQYGRTFSASDAGQRVAVLSHEWWVQRFGGDPRILGRSISLNDMPYDVIGVMPSDFRFPYKQSANIWIPVDAAAKAHTERSGIWRTVARLAGGSSLAAAQSDLGLISDRLAADPRDEHSRLNALPMLEAVVGTSVRTRLFMLLGASGLVLIMACVNVASLLLTRSRARSRELAVRAAIGADRWRLVRQLLTEAVVIGLLAGVAGVLLAHWTLGAVIALIPSSIPRLDSIRLSQPVLLCACALSFLSGLLTGLLPAWRLSRRALHDELKNGAALTAPSGTTRSGVVFVFAETSLAVVLLIGAGLMIRSLALLISVDPGFRAGNIVAIRLDGQRSPAVTAELRERAMRLAGVVDASGAELTPFFGLTTETDLEVEGRPPTPFDPNNQANLERVLPGYFRLLDIPVSRGRVFTKEDRVGAPLVAVINEAAVRKYFPQERPLGLRIYGGDGWHEIIGIVKDVHWRSLADDAPPAMYFPLLQLPTQYANGSSLLLRIDPSSHRTIDRLKTDANAMFSPLARVLDVQPMETLIARSIQQWKFQAVLLGTFGTLALILAIVGIFGVTSYAVVQRTREIGVRLALGASRADMLRLIVGGTARPVIAGLVLGLFTAVLATRSLAAFLFQLKPTDPPTYAVACALFLSVAVCAAMIPAVRAMRVDPVITLRHD